MPRSRDWNGRGIMCSLRESWRRWTNAKQKHRWVSRATRAVAAGMTTSQNRRVGCFSVAPIVGASVVAVNVYFVRPVAPVEVFIRFVGGCLPELVVGQVDLIGVELDVVG